MSFSYVSVCAGIEAATVAVRPLGWTPVAYSEIEPVCNRFLADAYPETPNVGDMLTAEWGRYQADVLIGGTPCQSYSTMGRWRREAAADLDDRGKLAFIFLDIADEIGAHSFIWENVPNVVTIKNGEPFRRWLQAAQDLGYGVGWRVLNTTDFGLPTNRPRLFAVGHRGPASFIHDALFEPRVDVRGSLSDHPEGAGQDLSRNPPRRLRSADGYIGFDAAAIKPAGRQGSLPALLKGHAEARKYCIVTPAGAVRRLAAVEGERAMGFPSGYTDRAGLTEGQRLGAIGNSFSPVILNAIAANFHCVDSSDLV